MTLKTNSFSDVRCWSNTRFASSSYCWHQNSYESCIISDPWWWYGRSRWWSWRLFGSGSMPKFCFFHKDRSKCWGKNI